MTLTIVLAIAGLVAVATFAGLVVAQDSVRSARLSAWSWPLPEGPDGVGRRPISLGQFVPPEAPAVWRWRIAEAWYPIAPELKPDPECDLWCRLSRLTTRPQANARTGAEPSRSGGPRPLVLYLPGWKGARDENTFLLANLASHGYIVLALDDRAHLDQDGRSRELGTIPLLKEFFTIIDARTEGLAAAASGVLAHLKGLDAAAGADAPAFPLRGLIDWSRVGIIGYSIGGSIAQQALFADRGFAAGINLDGWMFGGSAGTAEKPLLILNSDLPNMTRLATQRETLPLGLMAEFTIGDRQRQRALEIKGPVASFVFKGYAHPDFSDYLLRIPVHDLAGLIWQDRMHRHLIVSSYVVRFLETALREPGDWRAALRFTPPFPEVVPLAASLAEEGIAEPAAR